MIATTRTEREAVVSAVQRAVEKKFYDPRGPGSRWIEAIAKRKIEIIASPSEAHFEKSMNELLTELGVSHTGFFHESIRRANARMALSATLFEYQNKSEARWMFQDVHEGGPAHLAGIRPGDILLMIDSKDAIPPENPSFAMASTTKLLIRTLKNVERNVEITVPDPRSRRHPVIVPKLVSAKRLDDGIGWLKVAMFPGAIGIDVARLISQAGRELECKRLIIDLRGNTGGGIGCLRLMSLMTPDRVGVGYSLTRRRASTAFDPQGFRQFDRIPSSKAGLLPLFARYAVGDKSIAVFTEALGKQPYHGRIVLLVNEHSASASEMVAAFASENGFAAVVGERTPGRVVAASSFKVGHSYRVVLPIASYRTWAGTTLEGAGVMPLIWAAFTPHEPARDFQLSAAIDTVRAL